METINNMEIPEPMECENIKTLKRKISELKIETKVQKVEGRRASLSEEILFVQKNLVSKFHNTGIFIDNFDLELVLCGHLKKETWSEKDFVVSQ